MLVLKMLRQQELKVLRRQDAETVDAGAEEAGTGDAAGSRTTCTTAGTSGAAEAGCPGTAGSGAAGAFGTAGSGVAVLIFFF